jgi:hypothetical protein
MPVRDSGAPWMRGVLNSKVQLSHGGHFQRPSAAGGGGCEIQAARFSGVLFHVLSNAVELAALGSRLWT